MKKFILLPFMLLLLGFAKAQYVTIPDLSLSNWMQDNYPTCMVGNMLDTTCAAVLNATMLTPNVDSDMTGLQYFKGAQYMQIEIGGGDGLPLTYLAGQYPPGLTYLEMDGSTEFIPNNFPATLQHLSLSGLSLTQLPTLPNSVKYLNISYNNNITEFAPLLPSNWPTGLDTLIVDYNLFTNTAFPALPPGLIYFSANTCAFVTVPAFPTALQYLSIAGSHINFSDSTFSWPPNLTYLDVDVNYFTADTLPALPDNLQTLYAGDCQLNKQPLYPSTLQSLELNDNGIFTFGPFPAGLQTLNCGGSNTTLSALPDSLMYLTCGGSYFTTLPPLPPGLLSLNCTEAPIKSVPALPSSLNALELYGDDSLTSLPPLPGSLANLTLQYDPLLTCLPPLPPAMIYIHLNSTGLTCLPNYPSLLNPSNPPLDTLPLCDANSGCQPNWNISGSVYFNSGSGCTHQPGEPLLQPVKMNLWQGGNLVRQVYAPGVYSFKTNFNSYTVELDTTSAPFEFDCSSDSTVTISAADSLQVVDFEAHCKNGFDLGVNYITPPGAFVPGETTTVFISAGDVIQNTYGVNCNTVGLSGQVQINITGPVTYAGVANGVPTPTSVNSGTITWNVADFSQNNGRYDIVLQTDTSARGGDVVCVDISITPTSGDNNPANNTGSQCFAVHNSFDPNNKEVSPVSELPYPYSDWLTYTVHFQNTGTAAAHNITITDTLDANIDPASFQLLAYSYEPTVQITGRYVTFYFNQVMLPDSTANPQGSIGYVQYRVKPLANLGIGTAISNAAYIYFDFNAPVVTNSTTNTVSATAGIKNVTAAPSISIYPNPSASSWQLIVSPEYSGLVGSALEVFDAEGRLVFQSKISLLKSKIDLDVAKGVYWLRIYSANAIIVKKLVRL